MMDSQELIELILHGREERNLEYKSCISWDDRNVRDRITKTVLAMSNIPDGGTIVIGVEQKGESFYPTGLQPADRDSFKQDDASSYVNEYADPFVEITVSRVHHEGLDFVVIQVKEFTEMPVICKKDGSCGLRRGAIYTRPRRKYETAEVPSQVEMREIIDRAVEKSSRALQTRNIRAGVIVVESEVENRKSFEKQLKEL